MKYAEPKYHSYITDGLPKEHRFAFESIYCSLCGNMVHAFNNECMCPWFEFANGDVICVDCFTNPNVYKSLNLTRCSTLTGKIDA